MNNELKEFDNYFNIRNIVYKKKIILFILK